MNDNLKAFADRFSSKEVKSSFAYLVLMLCFGAFTFICLFEYNDIKPRYFIDNTEWTYFIYFGIGIISLICIIIITIRFAKDFIFKSDKDIVKETIEKIELPVIISNEDLKIIIASDTAKRFYNNKTLKTYENLDEIIKSELSNFDEWNKHHKERIEIAKNGKLDSTAQKSMIFNDFKLGHKEWTLTSCHITLYNEKHYFTIISPAKENDVSS